MAKMAFLVKKTNFLLKFTILEVKPMEIALK